jgi:hypothetical protein
LPDLGIAWPSGTSQDMAAVALKALMGVFDLEDVLKVSYLLGGSRSMCADYAIHSLSLS